MATLWLTRRPGADASVALVALCSSTHVFDTLTLKGIGRVVPAAELPGLPQTAASGELDLVVLAVDEVGDRELELIRALREGERRPALLVTSRFDRIRGELDRRLETGVRPDRVVAGALPLATLLHAIDQQLVNRCLEQGPQEPEADEVSFAELLSRLWQEKRTGVLRIMSLGVQTIIYLKRGAPIFAEQGSSSDLLGRILVEGGRITDAQLSEAVDILTNRIIENEQLQLGSVLVEMKLLTADELYETLATQMRRKVLGCFARGRFFAELREGEEYLEQITAFDLAMPELLIAGLQLTPMAEIERYLAPRLKLHARLGAAAKEVEARYKLGGRASRLLTEIDGARSLGDLRVGSSLGRERTSRLLMGLLVGGAVVLKDWAEPATEPEVAVVPDAPRPQPRSIYGTARKPGSKIDETERDEKPLGKARALIDRLRKKPER